MTVPTLQQLQDPPHLNKQEILILKILSGQCQGYVARRQGWNHLRTLGLLDDQYQLTPLAKIQLPEILSRKLSKV